MLEKINWQPLMDLMYPSGLYQVPAAPGRQVLFDALITEQKKRVKQRPNEHHGLMCIFMDPEWRKAKDEDDTKGKKCQSKTTKRMRK